MTDMKLHNDSLIDKKDKLLADKIDQSARMEDEIRGKDEAIKALSDTLIEKGTKNMELVEKITEMKNHSMTTHYLGQSFLV
jgi:mannitol/fructose-specific phosphotransferase system IIA component